MGIEAIERPLVDLDEAAKASERMTLLHTRCYRCGRDPDVHHDRGFCPAFADYGEAGRWISTPELIRAARKAARRRGRAINFYTSARVEESDGPGGEWHEVVGVAVDGKHVARLDIPWMPEFSVYDASQYSYDADHGSKAVASQHRVRYIGWRRALKSVAGALGLPPQSIACELGLNADRSTEELRRFRAGFL